MYIKVGLTLTQAQKEKLTHFFQNKTRVTLQLNANQLNGSDILGLTKTQHNQIKKAKKDVTIKLSKSHVSNQGGIFETLLATLANSLLPSLLGGKVLACLVQKEKAWSYLGRKHIILKTCAWTRFNS